MCKMCDNSYLLFLDLTFDDDEVDDDTDVVGGGGGGEVGE